MAIKKSELYSSLWASCDELRGGMDASEYKDYVLLMLFIKYISDKYAGVPYAPITVPEGSSFRDMVALKGKPTIGDDINKKIIGPIEQANKSLGSIKVDFDNPEKLGTGDEKVKRLSNLIAIFEKPELNFANNKAEGDDILGDAYEYLMRNFATESGKSKGQFYTPAEVSRIMAKIIGINNHNSTTDTTVYDPTCGSGSLLLKVADEAEHKITIYGQEKESATAGLARMNMVLHDCPTALIRCTGNSTLSDPQFLENERLMLFNYIVANPPFSSKNWSNGLDISSEKADKQGVVNHLANRIEALNKHRWMLHSTVKKLKVGEKVVATCEENKKNIKFFAEISPGKYGWDIRKDHRYFCVDKFYPTNFKKDSPGGVWSTRVLDLNNYINFKPTMTSEEVANQLRDKTWK